jgi:hypothetical protein
MEEEDGTEFILEEQEFPDFSDAESSELLTDEDEEMELEEKINQQDEDLTTLFEDEEYIQNILRSLPETNFYPNGIFQFISSRDDNQALPSLLQSLLKTKRFTEILKNLDEYILKNSKNFILLKSLKNLMKRVQENQLMISMDEVKQVFDGIDFLNIKMKDLMDVFVKRFMSELGEYNEDFSIQNMFYGEKRTNYCKNCNLESKNRNSETFLLLDLNLPIDTSRLLKVNFIGRENSQILEIKIMESATIKMLKESISKNLNLDWRNFTIVSIFEQRIFELFSDSDKLLFIQEKDEIYCFETNLNESSKLLQVEIYTHDQKKNLNKLWIPLLISFQPSKETAKQIYTKIYTIIKYYAVRNFEKFNFDPNLISTLFPIFGGNSLFELKNENFEKINFVDRIMDIKDGKGVIPSQCKIYINPLIVEEVFDFTQIQRIHDRFEGILRTTDLKEIIQKTSHKCNHCNETLLHQFLKLPDILMINLKRDETDNFTIVHFDKTLKFHEEEFELISFMVNFYSNLIEKDYKISKWISSVSSLDDQSWYRFANQTIQKVNLDDIISCRNSILIYQRISK